MFVFPLKINLSNSLKSSYCWSNELWLGLCHRLPAVCCADFCDNLCPASAAEAWRSEANCLRAAYPSGWTPGLAGECYTHTEPGSCGVQDQSASEIDACAPHQEFLRAEQHVEASLRSGLSRLQNMNGSWDALAEDFKTLEERYDG